MAGAVAVCSEIVLECERGVHHAVFSYRVKTLAGDVGVITGVHGNASNGGRVRIDIARCGPGGGARGAGEKEQGRGADGVNVAAALLNIHVVSG